MSEDDFTPSVAGAVTDPASAALAGGLPGDADTRHADSGDADSWDADSWDADADSGDADSGDADSGVIDEANRILGGRATAVLDYLARQIVDDPEEVSVEASEDRGGVRLELFVAPDDMGKVIGRKGRVAQAIRAVVRAAAAREGISVTVDIVD